MIREATAADYPGAFRVVRVVYPDFVQTEEGFRHGQESLPAEARAKKWVAEIKGEIVGLSRSMIRYQESSGSANINVSVSPAWRRRGIGSALYEQAIEHVADAPRAFAFTGEDGRAFAELHGFRLTQTSRISALDPRAIDTSELDGMPVELRTLAEVGPEATFAVDSVAVRDIPFDEPLDNVTYEQWRQRYWESPDFDFASSYAACVDGRPVAISYAALDLPGSRAVNAFTGTLPEYRGRGLARTVKLAVIRRLAELGVSLLVTANHEENAPMLAVNERLGFRPHSAHYSYLLERSGNGLRASAGSLGGATGTR